MKRAYNLGMTRPQMLIVLGLVVALAPFSGLPASWLQFLLPAIGIVIIAIAYSFVPKRESSAAAPNESVAV
jgi:chromate transport protein ChrA